MKGEGPPVEILTRRLSECPPDFLGQVHHVGGEGVHADAVVHDLIIDLGGPPAAAAELDVFPCVYPPDAGGANRLRTVLVACWLLHDPWFRGEGRFGRKALLWLRKGLDDLAAVAGAESLVADPQRREELARRCLAALGLRPAGESETQAEDRLRTLDSVERAEVIREMREKREQARRLREAARQKAAREAAAKASREW